jgi:hypothetical protein
VKSPPNVPLFQRVLFFQEQCQNYIRVLAKKSHDRLFVCGTYAFKPQCRDYVIKVSHTSMKKEKEKPSFDPSTSARPET